MIYTAFRFLFFFPVTTFPRDPATPTSVFFPSLLISEGGVFLFGILQVRGVNVHILYHGETRENASMIKVIKRAAVNVVPSECYHGPDGDANRFRIRQISP